MKQKHPSELTWLIVYARHMTDWHSIGKQLSSSLFSTAPTFFGVEHNLVWNFLVKAQLKYITIETVWSSKKELFSWLCLKKNSFLITQTVSMVIYIISKRVAVVWFLRVGRHQTLWPSSTLSMGEQLSTGGVKNNCKVPTSLWNGHVRRYCTTLSLQVSENKQWMGAKHLAEQTTWNLFSVLLCTAYVSTANNFRAVNFEIVLSFSIRWEHHQHFTPFTQSWWRPIHTSVFSARCAFVNSRHAWCLVRFSPILRTWRRRTSVQFFTSPERNVPTRMHTSTLRRTKETHDMPRNLL